jgi:hypothetical protein
MKNWMELVKVMHEKLKNKGENGYVYIWSVAFYVILVIKEKESKIYTKNKNLSKIKSEAIEVTA